MRMILLGDWSIEQTVRAIAPKLRYHVSHRCAEMVEEEETERFEYAWLIDDDCPQCYRCDDPVPDEIQTIIILLRGE